MNSSLKKFIQEDYSFTGSLNERSEKIRRFEEWVKQNSIKKYKGKNYTLLLFNSRYICSEGDRFFDHTALFETESSKRIFVAQPYLDSNDKKLELTKELIKKIGLKITDINEELSWHCPNSSILIQIELENESLFKKFLATNGKSNYCVPLPFKYDLL